MRRRMKILIDSNQSETEVHAKRIVKAIADFEGRDPRWAHPRGIATHTAHRPVTCEDCGGSYWLANTVEWAPHRGCPGPKPWKRTGF